MARLTPQTQSNYRVKLRKLRTLLPLLPNDHPEKAKVLRQIEDLTNKLGMEMTDLEIALKRGPGRPRQNPLVDAEMEGMIAAQKEVEAKAAGRPETKEEHDARVEANKRAFAEKFERENPELVRQKTAEQESEDELNRMINMQADKEAKKHDKLVERANEQLGGNNGDAEGHKSAADAAGAVGGTAGSAASEPGK